MKNKEKRNAMKTKGIRFGLLCFMLALAGMTHGEASEEETRAVLDDVLSTEYCGSAVEQGLGVGTAIRGKSPVMGRGFVCIEEADWGPVLLSMAAEELDRCMASTAETLDELRRARKAFAERGGPTMAPKEQSEASIPVYEANRKLYQETRKLNKMLSLMWQMESEREGVVQTIGRIARECPIEFNINRNANVAWICQTMKDGNVEKCLELGQWYRKEKGKGSEEEMDFCRQVAAYVLPNCTSQEQYRAASRYVLEAMDGCGNYPQCNGFDHAATDHLRGWVGSLQRRRMAERFLDRQPFRRSHVNEETGAVEYEAPTQEEVANLLRTRAAAELAADEKDLTDLQKVYGPWQTKELVEEDSSP
jgi:hypothetical protein